MNNKYKAAIAVAVLLVIFALLAWYMTSQAPHVQAPGNEMATSTVATTTAPAIETLHIKESARFYEVDAAYPSSAGLSDPQADAAAAARMKSFVQEQIAQFKKDSGLTTKTDAEFEYETFGRDAKYALTIEFTTSRGARTVSFDFLIYMDTMGAHPNSTHATFTFDTVTGKELALKDLFTPGSSYLQTLSTRARADLPKIMAKMAEITPDEVDKDMLNAGTTPTEASFAAFVIDGSTLKLIFPPYAVGPYVYGTLIDPIPLSALNSILKPEYQP